MDFGLFPGHTETLSLENLTSEQFLQIARETATKLGWSISQTSDMGFVANTKFSMGSWSEGVTIEITGGFALIKSKSSVDQMIEGDNNKENIADFITSFNEIKNTFSYQGVASKIPEIPRSSSTAGFVSYHQPSTPKEGKIKIFLSFFIPRQDYFITPILVCLNVAIFILMVLSGVNGFHPEVESLISWGANFRPLTLDGEWWRLITNNFIHIGFLHLFLNMYAFVYIGLILEPYLGRSRFAGAYLLTGISASITSLWWNDLSLSAGASGAIFGMYGVFFAMLTANLIKKPIRKKLFTSIGIFLGYNLLIGLGSNVVNAGHIGGLIIGLMVGYAYLPSLKRPDELNLKYITIGILAMAMFYSTSFAYNKIQVESGIGVSPDIGKKYSEGMKKFEVMESMALEVYGLPKDTPKEKMLREIRLRGLYYWNENIILLNKLDKLDVNDRAHYQNKLLLQYCDLRVKSYELWYKTVEEDTDIYKQEMERYDRQIEKVLLEIEENGKDGR